ncbi:hypothetical protein SBV1_1930037 [Verrucomicrobia bacterium]|nr:hypothetical protein SBV1_1930037 [Verrucomicrobiota bacterium]
MCKESLGLTNTFENGCLAKNKEGDFGLSTGSCGLLDWACGDSWLHRGGTGRLSAWLHSHGVFAGQG